jgi:hypothetical protein
MEDSIEQKLEPMFSAEGGFHDEISEVEVIKTKLTTEEFEGHLNEAGDAFKIDVMSKVYLLKVNGSQRLNEEINNIEGERESRVDGLRSEMRVLEQECYELKTNKEKQDIVLTREFNSRQRRNMMRKYFYALQDNYYAGKRAKKLNEEWCINFRNKNLLKMCVKYWKYFTFNQGNKAFENRLKGKVEDQIQKELYDRRLIVEALESAIRELELQKTLEIKKKNIIKSQCDQVYLRGASSTSMQALKMSQNTLNTLYAGVKMPQYNGQNLLAQINLLKDDSKTVTKKVISNTFERPQVTQ